MYVNAEGTPVGEFEGTADNIREVFARMGFNDRMTVAAIGGGHAFGKQKKKLSYNTTTLTTIWLITYPNTPIIHTDLLNSHT